MAFFRRARLVQFPFTLTNAQIKTLPTAAVVLTPKPGAGYAFLFSHGTIRIHSAAGAYTNVDPTVSFFFEYESFVQVSNNILGTGFLNGTTQTYSWAGPPGGGNTQAAVSDVPAGFDDQAIVTGCLNGALSNFTGGNAANTATGIIIAHLVPTG